MEKIKDYKLSEICDKCAGAHMAAGDLYACKYCSEHNKDIHAFCQMFRYNDGTPKAEPRTWNGAIERRDTIELMHKYTCDKYNPRKKKFTSRYTIYFNNEDGFVKYKSFPTEQQADAFIEGIKKEKEERRRKAFEDGRRLFKN